MIRHVVLLKWNDSATEDAIQEVTEGFSRLASLIPEIQSCDYGPDAGIYRGNADYAFVAEFRNEDDLRSYVLHSEHQAFMKTVTGPIMESFLSTQIVTE